MESYLDDRVRELEIKLREEFNTLIDQKFEQLCLRSLQTASNEHEDQSIVVSNLSPQKQMTALVTAISNQITEKIGQEVYQQIIGEINEKIVPQVNNMVEWVNYNTQDGGEVVDSYRRAAELQANKIDPNIRLITDGSKDKRIISEHVRTFFGGPDEDSSDDQ